MTKLENKLTSLFEEAIILFFDKESSNILSGVSERNLCGRLSFYIESLSNKHNIEGYYVDTEYNRKQEGQIKTILDNNLTEVSISCDLILHSRGEKIKTDNLIALEMKKSDRPLHEKDSDRNRLRALTKESYDNIWSNDGKTFPEHVCGYKLGVYMEIDSTRRKCLFEFYKKGTKLSQSQCNF